MRRLLITLVLASAALGCGRDRGRAPLSLSSFTTVDLSHALGSRTVFWPTSTEKFTLKQLAYGQTPQGYFYAANSFCTPEHGGTHLDAPIHFAEGRRTTDQIPIDQLVGPAFVIDVTTKAAADRDYRVTRQDVLDFEAAHGRIPERGLVLIRTGWSRHWPDVRAYLGDDTPGDASRLSFPGIGDDAARLLVEERRVGVLGIDTASLDYGRSVDFLTHRVAAAQNVPGLENLTNLDRLPPAGALVVALPAPIEGGSGGPLRAVALVPRTAGD